jgi:beta-barrel assembly-enhancing protease
LNDGASKAKGLLWVLLTVALAAGAAYGIPRAARHMPWRVERWMAGVLGDGLASAPCRGAERAGSTAALDKLVMRIDPVFPDDRTVPISIDVIPGDTVNAYAALGGHIHVFDGLLQQTQSPEELAGVLAHEIEHVRNRHITQGLAVKLLTISMLKLALPGDHQSGAQAAYALLTLSFSRQQEDEADRLGLQRLQAAHVDADGLQQFFSRARKMPSPPAILSSHPSDDSRAALAAQFRGYPTEPVLDPQEWRALRNICPRRTGGR